MDLSRPHRFVSLQDGRVAYWRFGRGPDVVMVHGWPLHSATFRHVAPRLAERFTVHLLDLPGTGHTEWNGAIGLRAHARTVRAVVDAIGLERYAFVAHDSGGAIARLVAAEDSRVAGLVLGNTEVPGHHPWQIGVYVLAGKVRLLGALMLAALKVGPIRRSALGFGGCFRDPRAVEGEFGELFVRPLVSSRRVAEGQMELARNLDADVVDALPEVHARIAAPALCIWGTDDPFFPLAKARAMVPQFAGGAELVEIPGAKLFAHEDEPAAFAGHAAAFLEKAFSRAAAAPAVLSKAS
jgi:pimeloyl-ACP methyl ester carboxylesterase